MEKLITDELIENTYLFCWKKLADKEDAKDLAQEIVVNAMLLLRSGKKIENFYALYWQIARNKVADFYRKKKPSKINLDDMENSLLSFDKSIGDFITEDELKNLSISMNRLAAIHRDILVRFYLKGQSVKEISQELNIPTGTVTGRLSDARKKLKENFEYMENNHEPVIEKTKTVDFKINYFGNSMEAYRSISSLIDKQILFLCRNEEKTITQLSKEMEVATVFIEDNVQKLCNGNVLVESSKGRYLTDFTIFPESVLLKTRKLCAEAVEKMKLGERYFEILLSMKEELLADDFYGNDFDWKYLLPYFIIRSNREFRKSIGADYIRENYTKSSYDRIWRYGFLYGVYKDIPDEKTDSMKGIIGPGYYYQEQVSAKYGRYEIHPTINSMLCKKDGKTMELDEERCNWLNSSNADLYRELTENPTRELNEKEQLVVADLLSKGVLVKTDNGYKGTIPVIRFETITKWCKSWYEKFKALAIEYIEVIYQLQKDILLPYIREDLLWASVCFFYPLGIDLDSYLIQYALDNKLVKFIEGTNNSCGSIVMLKE
ncbi:MAG: sigma-70 family RNA polymerase sigma factor [Treponema sp.]|nr:sigma-70 family RNA polymerase sigma factor [Treponema sp.]